jgi:hypothetical protein
MPRTAQQWAAQHAAQGAQLGLSGAEFGDRVQALRTPGYTAAAFDPAKGNSVPQATQQHLQAGGTWRELLGDRHEFLDRGGLGAVGKTGMRPGFTPSAPAGPGIAPGLQPPSAAPRGGGRGFASVQQQAPGGGRAGIRPRMGQ